MPTPNSWLFPKQTVWKKKKQRTGHRIKLLGFFSPFKHPVFWQTVDAAFYLLREVTGLLLLPPHSFHFLVTPWKNCCEAKTLICGSFKNRSRALSEDSFFWVHVRLNLPKQCSILPLFHNTWHHVSRIWSRPRDSDSQWENSVFSEGFFDHHFQLLKHA